MKLLYSDTFHRVVDCQKCISHAVIIVIENLITSFVICKMLFFFVICNLIIFLSESKFDCTLNLN